MNRALARIVSAQFVAVSDDLRQRYKVPSKRCVIIPNGIRVQDFEGYSKAFTMHEQSFIPVIGWTGRMVPVKGLEILLKAVAQMLAVSRVRVLLIGDGPERTHLENLAYRLGIMDSVRFAGFVPEPQSLLAEMDVFALPSLHEGIPMSLLEAFAAGVPVVAAAVGGIPGMVGASGAAHLVQSATPEAWAAALTAAITNPEQSGIMAKRGRRLVEERFSMEAMVNRYSSVYSGVVS
jgi:glycosyltransferase involved in cell wall biosynthesis